MPNDLTAKRNLSNRRADAPTSQRQKLVSSGFTASIWTISGVVLAACSSTIEDIEEFLGLDDDGDGGGNALHVQRSPVQGARIYFDMDNDGMINADDITAQDEAFPQGFVTDSTGRAHNIPAIFHGLPFKAVLDGAIDADTRAELSGELRSIPNADDDHLLASPITEYIAEQADTAAEVVAEWLGLDTTTPLPPEQERMRDTELRAILTSANYQGGDARIETLAVYLAHTPLPIQTEITRILLGDTADPDNTLIVVSEDMVSSDAVTIGAHDSYVATIQAVSHAGGVGYSFVDADGEDTTISDFNINAQGVISFIGENPTTATLHIEVSNGTPSESEIVRVEVTVADAPRLDELPAGDETATIMENVAGGSGDGTALITGITTSATNPSWEISEANPAGQSAIADKFGIVSGTGDTFNLVLKAGEILNYDAIPGGVLNLHVWAEVGVDKVRSNALALRIQVEQDPDEVAFSGSFTGIVAEDGDLVAQGTFSVENQPENEAVDVSSQGAFGELVLGDNGAWTYTLTNTNAEVDGLLTGQTLIDTATISVGGASQNIVIRIDGTNEDVRFVDGDDPDVRVSTANVPDAMNIEIGDTTALNGSFALGNVLNDLGVRLEGRLSESETTTVAFADSMDAYLRMIFDLDENAPLPFAVTPGGDLTFTGTNANALTHGTGIINLRVLVSTESTTLDVPLTVRVNIVNEDDNGPADYEIMGDTGTLGNTLQAVLTDPDGIASISYQWYRGDDPATRIAIGTGQATYEVTTDDVDQTLTVDITYTDASAAGVPITVTAATTPVEFTSPNMAAPNENDANWQFQVTATSEDSNSDGSDSAIASYELLEVRDENGAVVPSNGIFSMTNAGLISISRAFDLETDGAFFTLRVRATDTVESAVPGDEADRGTQSITVRIGDVNDNAPVFTQATYTADIDETLGNGAEVARVSARDDDGTTANNTVGYSITAGNTGNVFDIDDNGVITVLDASELDFETTPSYTLTITASDGVAGTNDATATVTITVNDINDEPPMVNAPAGTIRTTTGNPANTNTGYSITVTDADAEATNDFRVDSDDRRFIFERDGMTSTWNLVLLAGEAVSLGDFTLGYTATDGANTDSGTVTISAVDSSVSFDAGRGSREAPPITEGAAVTASDLEVIIAASTVTAGDPAISYAITAGDPGGIFALGTDGNGNRILTLASTTTSLDHESVPNGQYQVQITATEDAVAGTGNTAIATITVIVNDVEEGEANYIVAGNVQPTATLTAQLASTADEDPDGRVGAVTYRWFVRDAADADPTSITDTNSAITWLTDASSAADANEFTLPATLESGGVYGVAISYLDGFADGSTPRGDATFLVELASAVEFLDADSNVLTDSTYRPDPIAENTDSLPTVTARLESATFSYSITSGNDGGIFEIGGGTGANGAISVVSGMNLDFEAAEQHTLTIRVDEVGGDAFGFATVIIRVSDVNEHKPVFATDPALSTGTDEIAEDAANGTRVGLFRATDADGSNNDVTYSLDDGGLGVFGIQAVDGTNNWEIYVLNNANLDYDPTTTKPTPTRSYTIEITATDSDPDTTTRKSSGAEAFTINITDVNDNDPVLSATPVWEGTLDFGVPENTGTNVHLFTVSATDADENPSLTYEIVSIDGVALASIANPIFGIDASDGRVGLAGQLDRETKASHEIVIRAVDEGGRASNEETFTVTVGDVNDNKPVIPDQVFISTYASGVPESAGSGALFANDGVNPGVLLVNDDDLNQSFTYRIVSIDGVAHGDITNPIFAIQPTSGRFGLIGKLDYETAQSHSVVFEVTDQGGMVSEHKAVVITVLNEDEGDASYAITGTTANNGMLSVALDTNNPDPDGLVAGSERYRWFILNSDDTIPAAGDTNGNIGATPTSSTLSLPSDVGNNVYGVVVTYMDNADETEMVTVIASAVQFTQNTYTVSFNEATAKPVGDGVADNGLVLVTASLNTNPSEKPKNYKFLNADGDPVSDYLGFTIGTSGIINFAGSVFDFDNITEKVYTLTVRASYKSGETGIATVEITITDANDNTPTLAAVSDTTATIAENVVGADAGAISFTITDDDADTTNNFVSSSFTITGGTGTTADTAAKFEVVKNGDNWDLKVRADDGATPPNAVALDRETDGILATGVINLDIKVNDGVADSNVIAVEITVTDLNDNPPTSSGESGTATLIEADAANTNTDTGYSFTLADKDTDAVNRHEFMILGNEANRFKFVKDGTTANQWNLVLLAGQTVDREMDGASIRLNFQVTDGNNDPLNALSTTVAITDANESNPTVAITSIATTQQEGTVAAGGVNVASFAVTDADATAYARANVELSGDSRFEITGWDATAKTGMIRLKAGAVLDYETAADRSITLTITATDPLDNSVTGTNTVTITVTDENDNAPTATTSGTASLTEADAVSTNTDTGFSITLADDDTDTVNQHAITIDDTTLATRFGFVKDGTTANQWNLVLLANQKVDREGDGETLTIAYTISDDTNTPITDSVDVSIIDANDEPTVIGATKVLWESPTVSGTIPEGSYTAGTEIARAIVSDDDAGANLEYRLTKGGSTFSIGSTDGIITFTADTDLDADTAPTSYTLAYEVRDRNGAWESSGDITLTVTGIDDEKPELGTLTWQTGTGSGVAGEEHIRTINEDQGASPILVMSVSDPDTATASLTPTIQGGSPVDASNNPIFSFGILNNQAILSVLSSRLDHETAPNTYTLTLVVTDGTRTDTETVTINVGDINDNAPDIVVADSTPSVTARTASADTDIITGITVTDADVGKTYAQGDFELTGDSKFKFVWDATAQTGKVVLIDGQEITAGTISLSLTVTDANPVGHAGTDTETLTITVTELVNGGTTGTAMQYDPSAADASGTLTYIDAAQVKANPVAGDYTATGATYGTATVDASGTWTYNVDNTNAMVKGLASGATLTDTFTISVPLAAGGTGDVDVTVTITGVTVVEGTANADTGAAPGNPVNRAAATTFEVIHGSDHNDVITVGAEGAVVFGGYGDDTINLRNGKTDIVVYRFSSIDGGSWRADDGGDIINNFERGRDIFILVDDDATPIDDLDTLLSRDTTPFVPDTIVALNDKPKFTGPLVDSMFGQLEINFLAVYDVDGPGTLTTPPTGENVFINFVNKVSLVGAVTQGLVNDDSGDGHDNGSGQITDFSNVPNWLTTDVDTHVGLVVMSADQLAIDIL